jgi:hypothetical protein
MIKAIKSPTITFSTRALSRSFFALLLVAIAICTLPPDPFKFFRPPSQDPRSRSSAAPPIGISKVLSPGLYHMSGMNSTTSGMHVSKKQSALQELKQIPGVGKKTAEELWDVGIRSIADLHGRDPEELFRRLQARAGAPVDRCVLYVFRCAVYYASHKRHEPELLKWWHWKD